MRWPLRVAAALAIVVAGGACGSSITVPDQGIIVTGCQQPAQCFRSDCACTRDAVESGACTVPSVCSDPNDPSTCNCPRDFDLGAGGFDSQCIEEAQACIGRGVFCGGAGALCKKPGSTCDGTGDPPMLIPTIGMPGLEPHCQFDKDVCCPGTSTITDGGMPTD
jgi:hypothetical protein